MQFTIRYSQVNSDLAVIEQIHAAFTVVVVVVVVDVDVDVDVDVVVVVVVVVAVDGIHKERVQI